LKMSVSKEDQEKKVCELIKLLRIEKCQNTRIGDNLHRGVSGGERKRVSIAVELLSDTPILFLDEPTTGLDSYNAFEVISALNFLAAERKKIIIFTIHQPSSEIFTLLNKICVLALGKTVYFGNKEDLSTYFNKINLPIPTLYNPFEHIIEMTTLTSVDSDDVNEAYPDLVKITDRKEKYEAHIDNISGIYQREFFENQKSKNENGEITTSLKKLMHSSKHVQGTFFQIFMLCVRHTLITVRNKKLLSLRLLQNIVVGIIITLVFNNLNKDYVGNRDKLGLFNMLTILSVFNAVNANLLICKFIFYYILP